MEATTRPFREILEAIGTEVDPTPERLIPRSTGPQAVEASAPAAEYQGTELSQLSLFVRNSDKRATFTFVELEGYPILRVVIDGQCQDLILNNDQVKLLLRQMTLWLTR